MQFSQELALQMLESAQAFPVDFENAWQWIGYSTKQKAKNKLTHNFERGVDYTTTWLKTSQGGRPSESIILTLDCFKSLGMMAGTAQGKEIRRYFLECERLAKEAARIIPAQSDRIRELELQLSVATAQAEAAREQRWLGEFNSSIVTIHGAPMLALIQGRPEAVITRIEEVRTTVIADAHLRPLATFDGVGISCLAERYRFGKGKKANDSCRAWMRSVGIDDSDWVQEMTAHQTTKFPRRRLVELDRLWAAKQGDRQRLLGE